MRKHKAHHIKLRRLSQHDWVERINSIPSIIHSEKPKVASIVWYDFFNKQIVKHNGVDPSNFPLEMMAKLWNIDMEIEPERLAWLLTNLDYTEETAYGRSQTFPDRSQAKKSKDNPLYVSSYCGNGVGAKACFLAVCKLAVTDILALTKAGVIVNGEIDPEWPNNTKSGTVGYDSKIDVQNLMDWVSKGDMHDLIRTLDLRMDTTKFFEAIGLEVPAPYVLKVKQTKKYNQVNLANQLKQEASFVEIKNYEKRVIHY